MNRSFSTIVLVFLLVQFGASAPSFAKTNLVQQHLLTVSERAQLDTLEHELLGHESGRGLAHGQLGEWERKLRKRGYAFRLQKTVIIRYIHSRSDAVAYLAHCRSLRDQLVSLAAHNRLAKVASLLQAYQRSWQLVQQHPQPWQALAVSFRQQRAASRQPSAAKRTRTVTTKKGGSSQRRPPHLANTTTHGQRVDQALPTRDLDHRLPTTPIVDPTTSRWFWIALGGGAVMIYRMRRIFLFDLENKPLFSAQIDQRNTLPGSTARQVPMLDDRQLNDCVVAEFEPDDLVDETPLADRAPATMIDLPAPPYSP